MCGRFFRHKVSWEDYHAQLNLFRPEEIPELRAGYNIAPTQSAPIIRQKADGEEFELVMAIWGLIPGWWKKPISEKKFATFNAKSEEAASKSSFRSAWKKRPCLVPMSGYYEWKGPKGEKQPYAIALKNRRWFYVCGLWDRAYIDDQPVDSFTVLTTAANELTKEIHARMPVIPEQSEARKWITAFLDERDALMRSYDTTDMHVWKVGKAVGNVRNQGDDLIVSIEEL